MNAVVAVNAVPAGELLVSLRALGLRLSLDEHGAIKASPRDRVTLEVRSQIQRLRDGLVQHLQAERRRVEAMGRRWGYSAEDLQEALAQAELDPAGWAAVCDADENSARRAHRAGMSYP